MALKWELWVYTSGVCVLLEARSKRVANAGVRSDGKRKSVKREELYPEKFWTGFMARLNGSEYVVRLFIPDTNINLLRIL